MTRLHLNVNLNEAMVEELLDAIADDPSSAARVGDAIAYILQRVADARTEQASQEQRRRQVGGVE